MFCHAILSSCRMPLGFCVRVWKINPPGKLLFASLEGHGVQFATTTEGLLIIFKAAPFHKPHVSAFASFPKPFSAPKLLKFCNSSAIPASRWCGTGYCNRVSGEARKRTPISFIRSRIYISPVIYPTSFYVIFLSHLAPECWLAASQCTRASAFFHIQAWAHEPRRSAGVSVIDRRME